MAHMKVGPIPSKRADDTAVTPVETSYFYLTHIYHIKYMQSGHRRICFI